ncbi:MAG: ABC transporter substrate-binding protein [Lachnospiraceae bacterium]|nr:ABC transporter substrate-binding protein [Lachnospiraceae bacterium]
MKRIGKNVICLLLSFALTFALAGCGASGDAEESAQGGNSTTGEKIVNIGVTDSLGGMNPLTIDQSWINVYAVGLEFLPLVQLDKEMNFQPMLADSVTTQDNVNFIVHINEKATWSDGTPVTAADVEYTVLKLASPVIANATMMYYIFEGVGEDGFTEAGATSIAGVKVLDEKTIQFTTKYPISMTTFQNSYASYLRTLPKHVLEKYSDEELMTLDWFNHPDVVSGPFMVTEYDTNHYISYKANENYWMGAPKLDKLNFKIVDGSQVYAGLKSGEIDITHHTMTAIPMNDYESIEALENVNVVYGAPVTNQSVFIQTANVPDAKVRQALVYAIDREQILNQLLMGHGEIVDGFLSSASPYFDESITPLSYDPEKAKQLLQEAGWDGTKTLKFYVSAGDTAFVNAAQVMTAQWAAVGIKAEVQTVDHATLMSIAGGTEYDLFAVQYTYAPVDPYPDVTWLLSGEGSWTGYQNDEIDAAMAATQETEDVEKIKAQYSVVDSKMQEDAPMFSAYVISAQGAVNKRLTGITPDVYGFFNDIHNWDITD